MRNFYHTDVIVDYLNNSIDENILQTIPHSTRYNWRKNRQRYLVYTSSKSTKYNNDFRCLFLIISFFKIFSDKEHIKNIITKNRTHFITLMERCRKFSDINFILRITGISTAFYYYHLHSIQCRTSVLRLCFLKHPLQLSNNEISILKGTVKKYIHWPLSSVYYYLRKNNLAAYSISAFYKYCKILGLSYFIGDVCKYSKTVIRANAPGEIIHADITEFRISPTLKAYIFIVLDNFSRKILSWSVMTKKDGNVCNQKIQEALLLCKENCLLLTDDGSEFSSVDYSNHKIAQSDISFSNSMIEAFNKILKYYYLYRFNITSFEKLCEIIKYAVDDFNHRPHAALNGSSPQEIFTNTITFPDKELLVQLRQQRILENKMKCCSK